LQNQEVVIALQALTLGFFKSKLDFLARNLQNYLKKLKNRRVCEICGTIFYDY
jgi:hypothetical protein